MIGLPEGVVVSDDRPLEKRYRSAVAGLTRRVRLLYDAIYDQFGSEGLELIRTTSRSYGEEIAGRARKMLPDGSVASVADFVIRVFNTIGGEGEVSTYNDERVVIRVHRCPYMFDRPEMCLAHTEMEKALVENVSDDVRYFIECSIPAGDPYCDHVIEKR